MKKFILTVEEAKRDVKEMSCYSGSNFDSQLYTDRVYHLDTDSFDSDEE